MAYPILTIIFLTPLYGLFIWTYFHPEESMLLGQRWMYEEEPEFSEAAIGYTKFASIVGLFILTIILVNSIFNHYFIRLLFIVGLIIYIIYRVLKFRKDLLP